MVWVKQSKISEQTLLLKTEAFHMSLLLTQRLLVMAISLSFSEFDWPLTARFPRRTPTALDPTPLFRQLFENLQGLPAGL